MFSPSTRYLLHFDIRDICVSVRLPHGNVEWGHPDSLIQQIDGGEYDIPSNVNPIGLSAEQLLPYAAERPLYQDGVM